MGSKKKTDEIDEDDWIVDLTFNEDEIADPGYIFERVLLSIVIEKAREKNIPVKSALALESFPKKKAGSRDRILRGLVKYGDRILQVRDAYNLAETIGFPLSEMVALARQETDNILKGKTKQS